VQISTMRTSRRAADAASRPDTGAAKRKWTYLERAPVRHVWRTPGGGSTCGDGEHSHSASTCLLSEEACGDGSR
jgi:hypothetical protein